MSFIGIYDTIRHIGGSFQSQRFMVALYYKKMNIDPKTLRGGSDRLFIQRDTAPILYATLADKGFFPKDYTVSSFRELTAAFSIRI